MLGRLYLGPDLFDPAIRPNEESDPVSAGEVHAHEFFWPPNAISLDDLFVLIGEQGEGQFVFFHEFGVGLRGVSADAEDDRALFLYRSEVIAERAGLFRASGRIVAR